MDKILVVGGAGYVGSHACKALAGAGYLPVVFDDLSSGHDRAVRWGPLERGSLLDTARLDQVLRQHRPTAVMHFAGLIAAGDSVHDPAAFYRANVCATLNLLSSIRTAGIADLVFSSSAAVYGEPETDPITERHPLRPINPYGRTKLICEQMLGDFALAHDLGSVALRYFNAAGADPDAEIGEAHHPETHLLPLVLEAAAGLRPPVQVFGSDYDTADGTCIRDFVHVSDLADAHVAALEFVRTRRGAHAFNLGSGSGSTVMEVIRTVKRITGLAVPLVRAGRRPGDPARLRADASLAKEKLGWRPRLDSLDDQVRTAWRWLERDRYVEPLPVSGAASRAPNCVPESTRARNESPRPGHHRLITPSASAR